MALSGMSDTQTMVPLQRDVAARAIPSGSPIELPKNAFVSITQDKGGNFTVRYRGNLARIDGTDADALGLTAPAFPIEIDADSELTEDQVWTVLKSIYDPEIPVNIVDLGLVYGVAISDAAADSKSVLVTMTLTSPTCGMGQVLTEDIKYRLGKLPAVKQVSVKLVFDPPWSRDNLAEDVQLELGLF